MTGESAFIDGAEVVPEPGETILEAARRVGVDIPSLCHVEGLAPEGGCRLCSVEVRGTERPVAACHHALEPGMQVATWSPALLELRRGLLALIAAEHPGAAHPHRPSSFRALLEAYDVPIPAQSNAEAGPGSASGSGHGNGHRGHAVDASHTYLRFDPSLCITCRRCVQACEDVQGQFVFSVAERGGDTRLVIDADDRLGASDCTACGACVDLCPTHALDDVDRIDATPAERTTRTTCAYCGVGCQVDVEEAGGRVLRVGGAPDAEVNRGHLCAKGRYAHAYHHSPDRLTRPLLRERSGWRELEWEEALAYAARRLAEVRDAHGPDALGAFTSSRSTNEATYLLQKLFRVVIGTNNVDCCARVCHSSTALALQRVTGTGAASASYVDLERAEHIVVAGANATEAHPVVGARIKQAARRGASLTVIDPRRIELADYAGLHLALRPGTNVALFNAIAKVLVEEGLHDEPYVRERLEGWEDFERFLGGVELERAADLCGIESEAIREAARRLAQPTLFVHGLGLSELIQGTASVMALTNLGMLTGSIGRPGAGMLPLRGQNNVQGGADMGGMPNQITGYQPVGDPEVRERARAVWGAPPPESPGLTIPEMLAAAAEGSIKALWIQGEDVAQSDPCEEEVIRALESLDLLIVQELFLTETAKRAHLVFPAAGALEQDGTFTNGERRIQRVRPAVTPPGEARPDWRVALDVAAVMGARWDLAGPADVMDEIARVAPRLFGGVRYERLAPDGLQWPCPDADHPGTACVHAEGFLRGRGLLTAIEHEPNPEHGVEGYPYLLVTGRVLHQYNVGTMTRRTPQRELAPEDFIEVHPRDAEREGIEDGAPVELESRWGRTSARARVTRRVEPGTLFLSFHFPETHANRVVGPHLDPESKCPQYKVTSVRLRAAVGA